MHHSLISKSFADSSRGSRFVHRNAPMTDDDLRCIAPSVFAEAAHPSRSERYGFISTAEVLVALRSAGFVVFGAGQTVVRQWDRRDFTKHMLRLRHADSRSDAEADEIALINSHDGTSRFQLLAGLFRFFCLNSLVCGEGVIDVRVAHSRKLADAVAEQATAMLPTFAKVRHSRDGMRQIALTSAEQERFAMKALGVRYPGGRAPVTPEQVLTARRAVDDMPDLWSTFNRVQENLIAGGLSGRTLKGRNVQSRPVRAVGALVKLNRDLWGLAEEAREERLAA